MKDHSFVPQKLGMKLLEMAKNMKIKHSISSSSSKVWGNVLLEKALHGGANLFGKIYGGVVLYGA